VAIVGAASLKGKEVAEVLDERNFPSSEVKLLDDDQALGQLEAVKDEVTFIQKLRAEQFERVDFAFFASDAESTRRNPERLPSRIRPRKIPKLGRPSPDRPALPCCDGPGW